MYLQTDSWSHHPSKAMELLVSKTKPQLPIQFIEASRLIQHTCDRSLQKGQRAN